MVPQNGKFKLMNITLPKFEFKVDGGKSKPKVEKSDLEESKNEVEKEEETKIDEIKNQDKVKVGNKF